MPFTLIRDDITTLHTDAIVNAANSALAPGGGVCGAIFAAAGYSKLERACQKIGHCETGQAVITDGFSLPAKHIIHTVGPIWRGGDQNEAALLESCYRTSLELAEKEHCRSIAFPLISSGIYGYPKQEALTIAVRTIRTFLETHEMEVTLVLFDRNTNLLGKELFGQIQTYIDDHYAAEHIHPRQPTEPAIYSQQRVSSLRPILPPSGAPAAAAAAPQKAKRSLLDRIKNLDESFSHMLLRLIDERGMTDVEVYKRANIDRKLFSKLRRDTYSPSKPTVLALAVALRLNLDETQDLLQKAGFALSHSSKFDVILEYFIIEGQYDIYEINEALFTFDQRLLGA